MTCERCRGTVDAGRLCVSCFTAMYGPPPSCESPAEVDRKVRQARAKRLAREMEKGRTYSVGNGWCQRPGVTTFDRGYGLGFR